MLRHSVYTAALLTTALTGAAQAATYNGNENTGFGGPVGNSVLTVTDDGSTINLSLDVADGQSVGVNVVVFYLDTIAGGFSDTSSLMDDNDGGRKAISGFNDDGGDAANTVATFASGFEADYALALSDGFAAVFQLVAGGNGALQFVPAASNQSGGDPLSVDLDASLIGLSAGDSFDFVATLISQTAFRSDETIGAVSSVSAGFNGGVTFSESLEYTLVPEPASAAAVALFGLVALRRRR